MNKLKIIIYVSLCVMAQVTQNVPTILAFDRHSIFWAYP